MVTNPWDAGMPGPALDPPGGLHQHLALVALTPALLAVGAAAASAAVRGRGAYVLSAIALVPALLLQALFLVPDGIAAQAAGPHLGGLVRIGWVASASALLLGLWAAWHWRHSSPVWTWPLRVALAALLPVLLLPPLLLGIEPDSPCAGRRWRMAGILVLTPLGCWWPAWAMTVAAVVAASAPGPWRAACVAAALASSAAALA